MTPIREAARALAVGSDHPARGAGTIGFVSERSSGGGAPGSPSWAIAERRSATPAITRDVRFERWLLADECQELATQPLAADANQLRATARRRPC
jgi:hypothetical protein